MTRRSTILLSTLILLSMLAAAIMTLPARVVAASPPPQIHGPFIGSTVRGASFDGDVRNLPPTLPDTRSAPQTPLPRLRAPRAAGQPPQPLPGARPAAAPRAPSPMLPFPMFTNFDGIQQTSFPLRNAWPPDPNGDVGRDNYIQAVNRSIGIYDKSGTPLASFAYQSIFTGTGTLCDTNARDDPVVLFDSLANRWMFTFFAFGDPTHNFYQCFAVSKTSDPVTGGWWLYGMLADSQWLDDYPKFALWPDAYYMTANMFQLTDGSLKSVRVWALDRASMLNGTLNSVSFDIPNNGFCCFSMLPATLRGAAPPAGAPDYLMDADFLTPGHLLHLWKFHVDWTRPLSSTFTGPTSLTVTTFDPFSNVIPQLGSSEFVDAGDDNLMTPLQYRNVNGVESLWATHTIAVGNETGLRWYEIRNPGGVAAVYQQGTFHLPDSEYRWMPSLSVDGQGNMALGYSVSGSDMYPSIRITGRLATDPPGTVSALEGSIIEGTGSQLNGYARWGDYTAMSVDPNDDCTFWYTNMYYPTTGPNWHTRIGSFSFTTCVQPSAVTLQSFHTAENRAPLWPPVALAATAALALAATGALALALTLWHKRRRLSR